MELGCNICFANLILDFLLCHHPEVDIKGSLQREDDLCSVEWGMYSVEY